MPAHYTLKRMSPQLLVTDLERAITFYTQKLGFAVEFRYEGFYCGIIKDGYSIHLKTGEPVNRDPEHENLFVTFAVDNIEELYRQLSIGQVVIAQRLRKMPYGTEFYVEDPDGYVIAFIE